jgi:hypothetical protein
MLCAISHHAVHGGCHILLGPGAAMHDVHTMKLGRWGPPWWGVGAVPAPPFLSKGIHRTYIDCKPHFNAMSHGLQGVLNKYLGGHLRAKSARELARGQSMHAGHGKMRCGCRGKCKTRSCSCYKAGRHCTSRCHRGSCTCENKD